MRLDDEDGDQSLDLEQLVDAAAMDPRAQQLLQLLMRSQDLDDGASGDNDDSDADACGEDPARPGAEVNDAPVVADVELDLTARTPAESPADALPQEVRNFCSTHGVDLATLPNPDTPAADAGVTFESLLAGEVAPISVHELQLVSHTTSVDPSEGRTTLTVRNLALCGRLAQHGQPDMFDDMFAVRLHMVDRGGDDLRLIVLDSNFGALPAADFAREARLRYPEGTSVALIGFDLIVLPDSFVCILNLSQASGGASVHRLGDQALPPLKLSQVDRQCTLLRKAGFHSRMVKQTVEGTQATADEIDVLLRPIATSLAVAHLRLGAHGIALAYATAAAMLVFQKGPPVAACVAAQVLNKMGFKNGACSALYLGCFPNGHELEPTETVGHMGLKQLAGIDNSRPNVDTDANLSRAIIAGMTQIAQALAQTEKEWIEHGLGDVSTVQAAAERAAARHGSGAATALKQQADQLFKAGNSKKGPLKNRGKIEQAVEKWRAALWLMLDPEGLEGRVGFHAWSIINTRYQHWDEANGTIEPKALHYMDLAALTVLRDRHVNVTALRANVYKGRCKLGSWEDVLDDALESTLCHLDIAG